MLASKPNVVVAGRDGDGDVDGAVAQELKLAMVKAYKRYCSGAAKSSGRSFVVGLSGGSLPKFFMKAASMASAEDLIDWTDAKFVFCDERLVDPEDPESTFGVYRKTAIGSLPGITEDNFVPVRVDMKPDEAAVDYEAKLRGLAENNVDGWPIMDLALLGMGPDGHTCSLFPGHSLLQEKSKAVAHIVDSPKPPPVRVTLTLPVINAAAEVVFVATGAGKKTILKEILVDGVKSYPASLVSPGSLTWIIDVAAAAPEVMEQFPCTSSDLL